MLGSFLAAGNLRANEIRFLDEVVDHLKEHGRMEVARHYESPYMALNPQGVVRVFGWQQVDELISILEDVPAMPLYEMTPASFRPVTGVLCRCEGARTLRPPTAATVANRSIG